MLNLSQLARESGKLSFFKKIKSLRDPDICLAEDVNDYLENAPNMKFPIYKKDLCCCDDRVYISIMDIKLETLKRNGYRIPNWFVVSDESGADVVYWCSDSIGFPALHSFEKLQEEQGLMDGDWVYDILLKYLIDYNLSNIVEVRKYNFSRKEYEQSSLLDKIRGLLPELPLVPQHY